MDISAYYNGRGITYLEKGRHEEAVKMFKEAAKIMHGVNEGVVKKIETEPRNMVDTAAIACLTRKGHTDDDDKDPIELPSHPDNLFIYSRPIHFANKRDTVDECTLEASAILFNMALAYHTSTLSERPLTDALENACLLYEMSYNLTMRVLDRGGDHAQRIAMASVNNLGQLHLMMGDLNKCQEFFQYLSAFIMKLESPSNETAATERQEFLLNALILANPYCAAAAA